MQATGITWGWMTPKVFDDYVRSVHFAWRGVDWSKVGRGYGRELWAAKKRELIYLGCLKRYGHKHTRIEGLYVSQSHCVASVQQSLVNHLLDSIVAAYGMLDGYGITCPIPELDVRTQKLVLKAGMKMVGFQRDTIAGDLVLYEWRNGR